VTRRHRVSAVCAAVLVVAAATPALAHQGGTARGPNTTTDPYVIPDAPGVHITSLLTVDDSGAASDGYEMTGIPDGLGAVKSGRHDFSLFMNHEFNAAAGGVHRHCQKGAYVSTFSIDNRDFEVNEGHDTIDPGVFDSRGSKRGYSGQIYFANEENADEGRAFGVLPDGRTQQLPRLGLFSWENTKPAYNRSDTTMTIGNEDGASGQLRVYEGVKRSKGNAFDRAGLTNGVNSVIDMVDETVKTDAEFRAQFGKGKAAPFDLSEVDWDQSGARQNAEAAAEGLSLNRIEDGGWDPRHPNTYYLLTTEGGSTAPNPSEPTVMRDGGGLWKVTFEDIERPRLGGTVELVLDGSEAPYLNKPDNLDIDTKGNLLIQEDPGGNDHVARIVAYNTQTGARGVVAAFDPDKFKPGAPHFITNDEESSGIIDAKNVIGPGWFVFDAQVHKPSPNPDNVELGQLLVMKVDNFKKVYDLP
jgi:hypothetical protein